MPAVQVQPNGGSELTPEGAEAGQPSVHEFLEMALNAASEQGMSTSELMGIFFYYAHSIAESYRLDMIEQHEQHERGREGEEAAAG